MSFTPYLSSISEALMKRVYPHVADARARDALEACVRALAGIGATLEVPAPDDVAALPLPAGVTAGPALLISDPPENLAACDQTGSRLAAAQAWLQNYPWLGNAAATATANAMLSWERRTIAAKIELMYAVEDQSTVADGDLIKLQIDRHALERYLQQHFGWNAKVAEFRQAVGGRSRQTAVFTLEGTALPKRLVVQRDHPASITRDGIAQQYPVIELLSKTTLKISRPLLLETDRTILGAPFMLLEAAPGTVAGTDYFRPPQQPDLAMQLAAQLAILHAADPTPLKGTLRCTIDRADPNGWAAELAAVRGAWERFAHAPSLTVAAAFAWMEAHVDQIGNDLAIVHNDAAFHNILVEDGQLSSLLDFELVHLGHPAEDLGYCRPFIQEIADWDAFVEAYVAAGGKRYDRVVLDYFSLRGGVHLLTLLQYGRDVFKSGVTNDINLAEVATSFIPKQHGRVARMVEAVLAGGYP
jgi:aminoglycoside phosphotransferase (APT) family kinase protein